MESVTRIVNFIIGLDKIINIKKETRGIRDFLRFVRFIPATSHREAWVTLSADEASYVNSFILNKFDFRLNREGGGRIFINTPSLDLLCDRIL